MIGAVQGGIKAKKSLAQIQAMRPAARWEPNVEGAAAAADEFVGEIYQGLMAQAKPHSHH